MSDRIADARAPRGAGPRRAVDRTTFAGRVLHAVPAAHVHGAEDRRSRRPTTPTASRCDVVGRRGKYLLLEFESVQFAVHLMQGGRLLVDAKQSAKPRGGQARFVFDDGPALLLTEAGTERRAGVWAYRRRRGAHVATARASSVPRPTW